MCNIMMKSNNYDVFGAKKSRIKRVELIGLFIYILLYLE